MAARNQLVFMLVAYFCIVDFHEVNSDKVVKSKTIIIGCGMSGIGFAETLYKKNNKDFLILEARDRVGGRIREGTIGGVVVSLGAAWIHRPDDKNPVWKLKKKHGLQTTPDNFSSFLVRDEKEHIVANYAEDYTRLLSAYGKLASFKTKGEKENRRDVSLRTSMQILGWNAETPVENVLEFYAFDFNHAISPSVISTRASSPGEDSIDQIVTDQRGYSYIARKLAEPFMSKIHFNTTVRRITHNETTVVIHTVQNGVNVTYAASHVILTVSTGVLGSSYITFQPKLPMWKMEAVYQLPMGYHTKVFLKFPNKFWDDSYYILTATNIRGYLCDWQNFNRPGLFPSSNILVLTLTGEESKRIEKLTDDEIKQEAIKGLKKMYGSSVPQPTEMLLHRWSQDPLSMGTYSNPIVGYHDSAYKALRAPIGKLLWFTGEATNEHFYAYTHGAYMAGSTYAEDFLTCIGGGKCPTHESESGGDKDKTVSKLLLAFAFVICQLYLKL